MNTRKNDTIPTGLKWACIALFTLELLAFISYTTLILSLGDYLTSTGGSTFFAILLVPVFILGSGLCMAWWTFANEKNDGKFFTKMILALFGIPSLLIFCVLGFIIIGNLISH